VITRRLREENRQFIYASKGKNQNCRLNFCCL